MRLDRNVNTNGRGKYAVVKLRKLPDDPGKRADCEHAMRILANNSMLFMDKPGDENEFFVLMLKDNFSGAALYTYAEVTSDVLPEYSSDVKELARRAGPLSPFCKVPD